MSSYFGYASNYSNAQHEVDSNDSTAVDSFDDEPAGGQVTPFNIPQGGLSVREDRTMQRHDSMFSVDSKNYQDVSNNDLNVVQAAFLLMADCMGTGLLALPEDIEVLGRWIGLGFLILNLPINLYAGKILSDTAAHVERVQSEENDIYQRRQNGMMQQQMQEIAGDGAEMESMSTGTTSQDGVITESPKDSRSQKKKQDKTDYVGVEQTDLTDSEGSSSNNNNNAGIDSNPSVTRTNTLEDGGHVPTSCPRRTVHHDTATYDFIGMTQALFSSHTTTRMVMAIFYTNLFLVLGDYILVMSHAVSALIGEEAICLPRAGMLAVILMYGVTQTRTMASLGRTATMVSLLALFVVVGQCLWAVHMNKEEHYVAASPEDFDQGSPSMLRKFSALGGIGFAVSSQKLFLNIRHELADRREGPKTLGLALTGFGSVYIGIILLAGSSPPGFLFDAIPPGWNRKLAGLLLWIHVVVSYAINSQAICASMDRLFFCNIATFGLNSKPRIRWLCLTGAMSISSYSVANAIPFFKDLVSLIGALTSVPLCLALPAIFYRQYLQVSIWCPTKTSVGSYSLLVFACVFLSAALAGSLSSIELDWSSQGAPFACH